MDIYFKNNTSLATAGDKIPLRYKHLYIENTSVNVLSTLSVKTIRGDTILQVLPNEFFDLKDVVQNSMINTLNQKIDYEELIVIVPDTLNVTSYKIINYGTI